jgi:hypothetical protein
VGNLPRRRIAVYHKHFFVSHCYFLDKLEVDFCFSLKIIIMKVKAPAPPHQWV